MTLSFSRLALTALIAGTTLAPAVAADKDNAAQTLEEASQQGLPSCCTLPSRWAARAPIAAARLSVEESEAGARVLVDGELFAEYLTDTGSQPAVWPIHGPGGQEMTRSWPLGPLKPGESKDHPHHESFWFSHGGVNGHDFWHKHSKRAGRPRIVHREFLRREATAAGEAIVETTNEWTADGKTVLSDQRAFVFGVLGPEADAPRYLDTTFRLTASDGDATFADTKEGTFAFRVPGTMKREAGLGGRAFNSRGQLNHEAWGQTAEWAAYQGLLDAPLADGTTPTGGVAIMVHPGSDLPEFRWHVRGYGLFAANPFGTKQFTGADAGKPEFTLPAGETLTLRFRTVLFAGDAAEEQVSDWYTDFAATPTGRTE